MLPAPVAIIDGAHSFDRCQIAVTFSSIAWRKVSRSSSSTATLWPMPALFTSTSTRPKRSSVSATTRSRSSDDDRSAAIATAPGSCSTSELRRSARRATTTTVEPTACSTRANRSPRPDEAPVTIETVSSSRNRSSGWSVMVASLACVPIG